MRLALAAAAAAFPALQPTLSQLLSHHKSSSPHCSSEKFTGVHSCTQSLLLRPCLRISFHDKPALFRASCHCTASATRQPVLTGSGAPRHWGELVPAPPAPIPSIPPRPNSPLVVCAGHHCTAGREATQHYVLRGTRAALQRKPTSAPPCVSRNS